MALAAFLLMTMLPIASGLYLGRRFGGRRMLRWLLMYAIAAAAAWGTARLALDANCHWPFGLLTPFVLSTIAATATLLITRRVLRTRPQQLQRSDLPQQSRPDAIAGAIGGSLLGGIAAIATWLLVPLLVTTSRHAPESAGSTQTAIADLCSIAHQGFLQHLPILGEASNEATALVEILRASPAQHRRLAEELGFHEIQDLPAVRAALDSGEVRQELRALRGGNLLALYRLQRHALIVAIAENEAVTTLFGDLRPTLIVALLHAGR